MVIAQTATEPTSVPLSHVMFARKSLLIYWYEGRSKCFATKESEINIPPPDYPGLEYPPVFEPGTYTLDASTLLPRAPKSKP